MNDYIIVNEIQKNNLDLGLRVKHMIRMGEVEAKRLNHLPGRPYAVSQQTLAALSPIASVPASVPEPRPSTVSKEDALRVALRLLEFVVA